MTDTDRTITTRGDLAYGRILTAAQGSQAVTVHTAAGTFHGYVHDCKSGMAEIRYDGEVYHVRVNHITALQLHGAAKRGNQ